MAGAGPTHASGAFLTIALASSRMAGMERMLYSAPFTYGCICRLEGENAVICKFSNTIPLRDQTPLRTLANEERVSPSSRLSECQASPPARPRDSHDEEFGSKFTAPSQSSLLLRFTA